MKTIKENMEETKEILEYNQNEVRNLSYQGLKSVSQEKPKKLSDKEKALKELGIKELKGIDVETLKRTAPWILSGEMRDAVIRYEKDKKRETYDIIFEQGVWLNGLFWGRWEDGVFSNGTFYGSVWENGIFQGGKFCGRLWLDGEFEGGVFEGNIWEDGIFNEGEFFGNIWKSGEFYGGSFNGEKWLSGSFFGGKWKSEEHKPYTKNSVSKDRTSRYDNKKK